MDKLAWLSKFYCAKDLTTLLICFAILLQSTLFNAICVNAKAQAANFPFCTIEPNVGVVAVPDDRLQVRPQMRLLIKSLHWSDLMSDYTLSGAE